MLLYFNEGSSVFLFDCMALKHPGLSVSTRNRVHDHFCLSHNKYWLSNSEHSFPDPVPLTYFALFVLED